MKPDPIPDPTDADLDLLLQAQLALPAEQIAPSSGFAMSVMEAIQQKATELPPIAFPWRRVLPGAILILCALAAFVFSISRTAGSQVYPLPALSNFTNGELLLCSVLVGVCLSAVAIAASFRLAGRTR